MLKADTYTTTNKIISQFLGPPLSSQESGSTVRLYKSSPTLQPIQTPQNVSSMLMNIGWVEMPSDGALMLMNWCCWCFCNDAADELIHLRLSKRSDPQGLECWCDWKCDIWLPSSSERNLLIWNLYCAGCHNIMIAKKWNSLKCNRHI